MTARAMRPGEHAWARRRGAKMREFLAHWWRRMALGQALRGETCSGKVRAGVMLALRRAERRLAVGLATMGCWQFWRRGRAGSALPVEQKVSPNGWRQAATLCVPAG